MQCGMQLSLNIAGAQNAKVQVTFRDLTEGWLYMKYLYVYTYWTRKHSVFEIRKDAKNTSRTGYLSCSVDYQKKAKSLIFCGKSVQSLNERNE